jgi:hypothetical protein
MLHPPMEPDSETALPYGALARSQISISKPIDWLGSCQKHGRMLSPDSGILRNPREMRLIDVLHQCIVPAPERASYVRPQLRMGRNPAADLGKGNRKYSTPEGLSVKT